MINDLNSEGGRVAAYGAGGQRDVAVPIPPILCCRLSSRFQVKCFGQILLASG